MNISCVCILLRESQISKMYYFWNYNYTASLLYISKSTYVTKYTCSYKLLQNIHNTDYTNSVERTHQQTYITAKYLCHNLFCLQSFLQWVQTTDQLDGPTKNMIVTRQLHVQVTKQSGSTGIMPMVKQTTLLQQKLRHNINQYTQYKQCTSIANPLCLRQHINWSELLYMTRVTVFRHVCYR